MSKKFDLFRVTSIARICHEANRAYCEEIGDNIQKPWPESPSWQTKSACRGVEFHLSGDHSPSASHEAWLEEKKKTGWVYGEIKDAEKKTHPAIVPYDELPAEQQLKDKLFKAIVEVFK